MFLIDLKKDRVPVLGSRNEPSSAIKRPNKFSSLTEPVYLAEKENPRENV